LRSLEEEFDQQVETLLARKYPKLAGISPKVFRKRLEALKLRLKKLRTLKSKDLEKGYLPFVIVIKSEVLKTEKAMSLAERDGKKGVTILRPHKSSDFHTTADVKVPADSIYLLVGIDRGKKSRNLEPKKALKLIKKAKRSPLTIDEGVAIVTHFPGFLMKNNCFSLLASRTGKDQRVPAIWINAQKQANLGWCWDGNPHTWLGSASAHRRIAAAPRR
jgi:hypothetical protein